MSTITVIPPYLPNPSGSPESALFTQSVDEVLTHLNIYTSGYFNPADNVFCGTGPHGTLCAPAWIPFMPTEGPSYTTNLEGGRTEELHPLVQQAIPSCCEAGPGPVVITPEPSFLPLLLIAVILITKVKIRLA